MFVISQISTPEAQPKRDTFGTHPVIFLSNEFFSIWWSRTNPCDDETLCVCVCVCVCVCLCTDYLFCFASLSLTHLNTLATRWGTRHPMCEHMRLTCQSRCQCRSRKLAEHLK